MTAPQIEEPDDETPTSDVHTGGMIALVPDNPEQFAVPGGDPVEQMHLTLAYLGDDMASLPEQITEALKSVASGLATDFWRPLAEVFAFAIWNPNSEDFEPATVYELSDNGLLCSFAEQTAEWASRVMGAMFPDQHRPFKPHITAGYNLDVTKLTYAGPVTFSTLRLALGGENFDFPLREDDMGESMASYTATGKIEMASTPPVPAEPEPKEPEAEPLPNLNADNGVPLTFPVIIVEGMETSDGRYIEPGSLSHRALPLSILAQTRNPDGGQGHDGADVVGKLTTLERVPGPEVIDKETGKPFPEGTFIWRGTGFGDPEKEGIKLAQKGYLTGNSADLSDVEAEFVWADDSEVGDAPQQVRMTAGKIAATTLVPIPAFAQAYVVIDGEEAVPNEEALLASASPAWRSSEIGDDCLLCMAGIETAAAHAPTADGAALLASATGGTVTEIFRPLSMFEDPQLDGPTPLVVQEDGRVYGHIATWGTCHIGFAGQCVQPPHSDSDYAYFRTGAVRVIDTETNTPRDVSVGHLTLRTGHADTSLAAQDASAHYDNTGMAAADVGIGEDAYGVWVAGAVRRGTAPEVVAELRASPISGDWRSINGTLELVAALAVNVPGFPIPRARVASGAPIALVAAGVLQRPARTDLVDLGTLASEVEKIITARRDELAHAARIAALRKELGVDPESRAAEARRKLGIDPASRMELARRALNG